MFEKADDTADQLIEVEFKNLNETFISTKGSAKDKIDAVFAKYLGFPIMSEAEFWKHMAYSVGEKLDTAWRAMQHEHDTFLAYHHALGSMAKSCNVEESTPTLVQSAWEECKVARLARYDALRKRKDEEE